MLSVMQKLPETSEFIPLISIYLSAVMSMSAISVCFTIVVLCLHYVKHDHTATIKQPPRFCIMLIRFFFKQKLDTLNNSMVDPMEVAVNKVRTKLNFFNNRTEENSRLLVTLNKQFRNVETRAWTPPPPPPHSSQYPLNYLPIQHRKSIINNGYRSATIRNLYEEMADLIDQVTIKYAQTEDSARSLHVWQLLALSVDRILFWSFLVLTIFFTIVALVVAPSFEGGNHGHEDHKIAKP